jgi:hypothetical protein
MERFGLTSLDDLPPLEAEVAARLAADVEAEAAAEDEEPADPAGVPAADAAPRHSAWTPSHGR